jgi:hypothetical protein
MHATNAVYEEHIPRRHLLCCVLILFFKMPTMQKVRLPYKVIFASIHRAGFITTKYSIQPSHLQ